MISASGDELAVFPRRDRQLAVAAGASLLLHGAALALLLNAWQAAPKVEVEIKAIPVTLIAIGDNATNAQAASAPADEPAPAPTLAMSAPSRVAVPAAQPAPPRLTTPTPPKAVRAATLGARPAAPSAPMAAPPDLTALLHEGVNGKPLGSDSDARDQRTLRASAAVGDDYLVTLKARLEPFASIPVAARAKHDGGIGIIGFTLARDGTVRRVWIEKATGYQELDDASIDMVRAASPLPPLPSTITDDSVSFFETVNYPVSLFDKLFR